jgi:hypothetical protein
MKKPTWQSAILAIILCTTALLFVRFMHAKADTLNDKYWVLRQPPYEIIYSGGYPYFVPGVGVVAWGGPDNNVIYVGNNDSANSSDIPHGVYRSANNGLTWEYLGKIDEKEDIKVLTVHPTNPNIVLAGFTRTYYQAGIYLSEDGGNSWNNVLPYLIVEDIEIDPNNPSVIYATGLESGGMPTPIHAGVYKSIDEGKTWQFESTSYFSDIEVHPTLPNILFATRRFSTNSYEGVYRSDDSGQTWNQISGIQQSHIIINENNPDQMFIFGESYQGIWRTDDSGQNWRDVTSNLPHVISEPTILSAAIDLNQTIWIGSKYDGMYISYNGGEIWQQESDGLPFMGQSISGPQCISSDISDNGKLIIACSGRFFIQNNVTFSDVPASHWAWQHIESIYNAGITSGCSASPLMYCPDKLVTRAEMAVFLLRGIHGSTYNPPSSTGLIFTDVPVDFWASKWIEQLADEGITSGCAPGLYCPNNPITRAQMAIFLLRAKYGANYTPPLATGSVFGDVPINEFAAAWIEQLTTEGITSGCGEGNYCPNAVVTRAQMAIFIQKTFNLQLP